MSFKRLDPEDFLVSAQAVTQTVWSNNTTSLTSFTTSSAQQQSPSGKWYLSVYNSGSDGPGTEVQFDIAYANKDGGGAYLYNSDASNKNSISSTIYGQYRTLLLESEDLSFNFSTNPSASDDFYVINISRSRYKEKLQPMDFNLTIGEINLTTNYWEVSMPEYKGTQRVYQIIKGVSGRSETGNQYKGFLADGSSYGWFLPDIGVILLSAYALDKSPKDGGIGLNTNRGSIESTANPLLLYSKLFTGTPTATNKGFTLLSEETVTSDYIFVRARNSEFNYSENPSFMKGSDGEVYHDIFINNPQVYPTTVGLYNDSNDLIAVAKLSRPLVKDFTKELSLRIKIDW